MMAQLRMETENIQKLQLAKLKMTLHPDLTSMYLHTVVIINGSNLDRYRS